MDLTSKPTQYGLLNATDERKGIGQEKADEIRMISVESEPGKGSKFFVSLPAANK